MPTLRSVGVHSQLCTKLASDTPPIATPLALLSRDAAATAQQLQVPLTLWQDVRLAVADALLIHSCGTTARIQQQQQQNSSSSSRSSRSNSNGNQSLQVEEGETSNEQNNPSGGLIVGSLTALEYWRHSQSLHQSPALLSAAAPVPPAPGSSCCTTGLNPWLSSRHLIQFTGPPSSGKTQVCLSMATQYAAASPQHKVFYLTSTTPPPVLARRLRQLAAPSKVPRDILSRIELIKLSTPYQLLATLQRVKERMNDTATHNNTTVLSSSSSEPHQQQVLLLLDSASGCLQGSRWDMTQQVTLQLKQLLNLHGASIVMTNGISSKGDAALGPTWNNEAPEIHIRLQEVGTASHNEEEEQPAENKVIRATLERHPHEGLGGGVETTDFSITAQGVIDFDEQRQRME